ncbi:MAG: dienelactone hydrolase family protein [Candidatus Tectomicrobia bacterium]|uniref:Dienelactone hydrolase family protein n=1 Tax=Tectimicrobiota bacterium TaxID=2528274 RepID=A0A938B2Q3_UNCTE|nr:dienelactone hydrolase family protein [Candidatus Tectomicrobia bacterium]
MDQRIIDLYDEYTHAPLDRREFLARLTQLTGSVATAMALVPLLEANQAHAALVAPDDARLETSRVTYPGAAGEVKAYLARQKGASKLPAVIVIHENRGLNPHIEDVTRRMALEGFLALGPDLLSPHGGTPSNEDTAREMISKLDAAQTVQNLVAALTFLSKHAQGNGKVGAMGFCWGGGMVGELAVNAPGLHAGVVYYGRQPKAAEVPKITAPLLLHYAGEDARINEGIPAFEEALKQANKRYTLHKYEGAQHAFNNDTSGARYNKQAAEQAWSRTLAFLQAHLRG